MTSWVGDTKIIKKSFWRERWKSAWLVSKCGSIVMCYFWQNTPLLSNLPDFDELRSVNRHGPGLPCPKLSPDRRVKHSSDLDWIGVESLPFESTVKLSKKS